jgi:hypothetical protein
VSLPSSASANVRCKACRVIRQNFLVPDPERLDPPLLSQRQRNEKPKLDELRNREVLVKLRPQGIVGDLRVPDDRARVGERNFLALAEARRFLEL